MPRASGAAWVMSCPRRIMRPASGTSNPPIMRSVVVLPQPEGPSSASISPTPRSKLARSYRRGVASGKAFAQPIHRQQHVFRGRAIAERAWHPPAILEAERFLAMCSWRELLAGLKPKRLCRDMPIAPPASTVQSAPGKGHCPAWAARPYCAQTLAQGQHDPSA